MRALFRVPHRTHLLREFSVFFVGEQREHYKAMIARDIQQSMFGESLTRASSTRDAVDLVTGKRLKRKFTSSQSK